MTEPTLESFVEFVNQQAATNPDREIDHTCWSSCAVANYADEELSLGTQDIDMCEFASDLFGNDDLYEWFNSAQSIPDYNSTYGELALTLPDILLRMGTTV